MAWSSDNAAVARVDAATGLVTAVAPGSARVIATVDGVTGSAAITVTAVVATRVDVTPAARALVEGQTQQLTAVARAGDGSALAGRTFEWSSSNSAVATVSTTGLVTAVGAGAATITARTPGASGPVDGAAAITVSPAPVDSVRVAPADTTVFRNTTSRLRATVYAGGRAVTGRTVVWSTTAVDVLAVNAATGDVTALNAPNRQGVVTATVEGKTGSATVRVVNKPVTNVSVDAPTRSLRVDQETQVTALLRDADGAVVPDGTASFSSTNPSVLAVQPTGPVSARAVARGAGTASVVVLAEGVQQQVEFTVAAPAPVAIARVVTNPPTASLREGGTIALSVATFAASGEQLTGRPCAWSSNSPAHATVDATGRVAALKSTRKGPPIPDNTLRITATCEGQSGSTVLVIEA